MPNLEKEMESESTSHEGTPEEIKRREKAKRKEASLRAAVGDYKQLDEKAKEQIIQYWQGMFKKEFQATRRNESVMREEYIKLLLETYGDKNMTKIFDTIKILYGEMLTNKISGREYEGVYYYYEDVIKSCLGLSQGQLNVITPELLKRMKKIIDAPGKDKVQIMPLTTLFEQGNRLYNSVVSENINIENDDEEPAVG